MTNHNFRSVNIPDHFIRHRNFVGELTRLHDGPMDDYAFRLIKRADGEVQEVALRSANFPDRYLRHRDMKIVLEAPAGQDDELFWQDSSFFYEPGLAGSGVSFRSVNFPNRYIRHRNFRLFLDEPSGDLDLFRKDATFIKERAAVLIDQGTELNPV